MFEIKHAQARRLINRQLDLPLSMEDWNALQNHLEGCPGCRAYQRQQQSLEHRLRQSFQARWAPSPGPDAALPNGVARLQCKRSSLRMHLLTVTACVVVFSLVTLIAPVLFSDDEPEPVIPQTGENPPTLGPTLVPTHPVPRIPLIKPGQFPHIVAYESRSAGNDEIYLLNPGSEPVNLTQDPAEDRSPTWSPDGEWLAFLSNRAGKNEIFLLSIAGNRLIQITDSPALDWFGPLSWSMDGKWIAAAGETRDGSGQRSIYLVGLDGAAPLRLPDTEGGFQPKFAPYGDRLGFYQLEGGQKKLVLYHIDSFEHVDTLLPSAQVAFDWAGDGDGLYYLPAFAQAECSQMVLQKAKNYEPWYEKLRDHFHRVELNREGVIQSFSWGPGEWVIFFAVIHGHEDEDAYPYCEAEEDCADARSSRRNSSGILVIHPELCTASGLDRGSWSLDMRWLVFTGYEPGSTEPGLYAMRMPGVELSSSGERFAENQHQAIPIGSVFRLSPGPVQTGLPRVRPYRIKMKIDPESGWEE